MAQSQKHQGCISSCTHDKLQLYVYGSCESDQYYHPRQQSQSRKPICLSEIEEFQIEAQDQGAQDQNRIITNPLFRAQIFKIACGALHTIVVTSEGQVYTFGCNDQGALGRDGIEKIPQLVQLPDPIDLVSAGDNHSVFANSQIGSVYFTGNYKYMRGESMSTRTTAPIKYEVSQMDSRLKNIPIQKVVSGYNHSAILVGGKIFIRGEPQAHTVGRRINQRNKVKNSLTFDSVGLNHVQNLWCGGYHSFAKVKKGKDWHYYAWGLNKHGQLGLRNYQESPYPQQIKKFKGKNIIDVAAGTNFTILLTEQGQLFGCGQNDDGQLGLGKEYVYIDSEAEDENEGEHLSQDIKKKMNLNDEPQLKQNKQDDPQNKQERVQPVVIQQEKKEEVVANQQIQNNEPQVQTGQKIQNAEKPALQNPEPIVAQPNLDPILTQNPQNKIQSQKKLEQKDIYIKSFKQIEIEQKLTRISAGSQFCFGWNEQSLYSWGFGYNFVLLTGQEDVEYTPFKVKYKIINGHTIYDLAAGAQHVVYLSYSNKFPKPTPKMSEAALQRSIQAKQKLSRRKKK